MMRNISGVRGAFYKYMIRRRSWANVSGGERREARRGSSARSVAAGRRTRAQRTNEPHSAKYRDDPDPTQRNANPNQL
ncbi:hypothetical protein RR46_13651 [Papilio xuthus]|uniref:Uncharacterized protein n=1 Tax=Papilio xuthus TaxID=66420 RepID=A0A194PMT1_PAPXU|nr:hypothetical protein RR46_13651 [Papilio xuthus]